MFTFKYATTGIASMTTTVTVDDRTRRRLKKLAAAVDVTQKEIIQRALDLLEPQVLAKGGSEPVPSEVKRALVQASKRVRAADPEWARISSLMEGSSLPIDEVISKAWGREF